MWFDQLCLYPLMRDNISTTLQNTAYKIEVSKYCDDYEKSQKPRMPMIPRKYLTKLLIYQSLISLHTPNSLYKLNSLITFSFVTHNIYRDIPKIFLYSITTPNI